MINESYPVVQSYSTSAMAVERAGASAAGEPAVPGRRQVRDVRTDAAGAEDAKEHEGPEELELLRQREHQRAQGGDVRLERVPGDGHELARQRHADAACAVLALVHAVVALVRGTFVGAHRVQRPVLGAPDVGAAVGQ